MKHIKKFNEDINSEGVEPKRISVKVKDIIKYLQEEFDPEDETYLDKDGWEYSADLYGKDKTGITGYDIVKNCYLFQKNEDGGETYLIESYKNYKLVESLTNVSKNRLFPKDFYDIYDLNSSEIGKYLNTWFVGDNKKASEVPKFKIKIERGSLEDFVIRDEMWTVKKVDEETSNRLYNEKYNPICLSIVCKIGGFKEGEDHSYDMIASIKSIDDSSYTIWFKQKGLSELEDIRSSLMKWISSKPILNGDEFIEYCIELGADKSELNYD